ncbi:Acyl-CoA dehydrogenase/oxidase C-terminal [Syntrophomonas zehnderi OL-4]|uniref:Acyl-CoA dehydrogenase/oxidase C-terminal n=1 Tax=Syntrophomonas zehnderi OL-4 TaxID=690567 RepID=A0A0E4C9K0_9FIRM|nr:acyl-CoA dehydrogenase family protein [Syntrophomonas zehnderi]CFY03008.1 Acyl-CoA dehydrogenase/oxidase C-terminal [Syntrophomonas zehnderi OL-4]
MDFGFTKEEALLQKMAREFAEKHIEPLAEKIDQENEVPKEILEGLAELELFGVPFPEKYGGADGGYAGYVLAVEQIARCSSGVGMIMSAHTLSVGAIGVFGTEDQKKKYMPPCCQGKQIASFAFTEPGTGSDPKQITSTAVKDGDSYILNGTKRFISNANFPGPIVIFARESESNEITAFIVDKFCEGYSISEPWKKMGMHGGPLLDVYLKDVRVPAENVLGQIGQGYPILQMGISFGKVGVSSCALGGMLAAYEEALKYAKEKTHRGAPIAKFQAIQLRIADLAMKYEASRWLTYRLGYLADNVKNPAVFAKEAALTKTVVCENSADVARISLDVHGSYGAMEDYKISRLYRDAIMGPQIEGVTDMQKMIISGVILKG